MNVLVEEIRDNTSWLGIRLPEGLDLAGLVALVSAVDLELGVSHDL